jgi:hypothetical protein
LSQTAVARWDSAPYQEMHILKQFVDSMDENLNEKKPPVAGRHKTDLRRTTVFRVRVI